MQFILGLLFLLFVVVPCLGACDTEIKVAVEAVQPIFATPVTDKD